MKTLATLTTFNGNKITSRATARIVKSELSKQGIFAQVVDHGANSDQRWGVAVVSKETLSIHSSESLRANSEAKLKGLRHSLAFSAKTSQNWLYDAKRKPVDVYVKKHVNFM